MKTKHPDTEKESHYSNLDQMTTNEILKGINAEDKKVAEVIENEIPKIELLIDVIVRQIKQGGRLFYIGAGTSGRI